MPDELPEQIYDTESQAIMFSGRFDDVRGINTFLDIAPMLADKVHNVCF